MDEARRAEWQRRYAEPAEQVSACRVLQENQHLLPKQGRALDLACGRGGNALLLASLGLETHAWDYAQNALDQLTASAQGRGLSIATQCRDVCAEPPAPESFDVIVVSHFLDRSLCPALQAALRPGGLLYYETFSRLAVSERGPKNPDFRLGEGELLELFPALRVCFYREEGLAGDVDLGWRDVAMLVGQRLGVLPLPGS